MLEANIENLIKILDKNKRIGILGTSGIGKTTLLKESNMGLNMNKEVFPLLSKGNIEKCMYTSYSGEIDEIMSGLVRTRLKKK